MSSCHLLSLSDAGLVSDLMKASSLMLKALTNIILI